MARSDTHPLSPRFLLPAGAADPYSAGAIPCDVSRTAALPRASNPDADKNTVAYP